MVFEHDFRKNPELSNAQLAEYGLLSPHKQYTEDFLAVVERVHDGDTVTLATPERDFTFPLRLLDIDAPELSEGGDVARDYLKSRVLGKEVYVLIDRNNRVGKYGRLLGHVLASGVDVGEEMLGIGLVKEFGFKKEGEPEPVDRIFRRKQWFR